MILAAILLDKENCFYRNYSIYAWLAESALVELKLMAGKHQRNRFIRYCIASAELLWYPMAADFGVMGCCRMQEGSLSCEQAGNSFTVQHRKMMGINRKEPYRKKLENPFDTVAARNMNGCSWFLKNKSTSN